MALSRVQYEQEVAGNRNFIVTMPYISRDHIKVSVTGNDVPFSWLNSNTVQLADAPNVGEIIDIRRETERQNLLVDFQDASTITEKQLDLATRQGFYLAQEAFDLTNSTMAVAEDGSYSASGRRISLLGEPDSDDDAATQGWVKGQYNSGKDAHQERLAAEQAASNASGSEGRAKTSETKAAQSEGKAKTSETNAAQSESKAKTSETNSAQSESNAKTSEVNAEAWAAGVNMPSASGNGLKLIRQKGDESGLEYVDIKALADLFAEVGDVKYRAAASVSSTWMEADGRLLDRTTYAELFAVIGTTYGSTNGSNFRLPDLRGEFLRGWDHGRGLDTGRQLGSVQGDAIRNITGTFSTDMQGRIWLEAANASGAFATNTPLGNTMKPISGYESTAGDAGWSFDASRQVPTANENRPRNTALMPVIKVKSGWS